VYATDVLTVRCGSVRFGLPLAVIERTVCFADGSVVIQQGPRGAMLAIDERIVHLRPLGELIGRALGTGDMRFAVVVRAGQREAAFTVDELGEVTRVVPQAVPPWVGPGMMVIGM